MARPFDLDPLFRALTTLPGIGPKSVPLFEKLVGGGKVLDLLWHKPVDFVDRRFSPKLKDAPNGRVATLEIYVEKHTQAGRSGLPYRVRGTDGTGAIDIVFFNANKDWINKQLPVGQVKLVSGKVEYYQGQAQMVHPDMIAGPNERAALQTVEPIYPLTAGVTNKTVRKALDGALKTVPVLPEWLDPAFKKKNKWPDWKPAVISLHTPKAKKTCCLSIRRANGWRMTSFWRTSWRSRWCAGSRGS